MYIVRWFEFSNNAHLSHLRKSSISATFFSEGEAVPTTRANDWSSWSRKWRSFVMLWSKIYRKRLRIVHPKPGAGQCLERHYSWLPNIIKEKNCFVNGVGKYWDRRWLSVAMRLLFWIASFATILKWHLPSLSIIGDCAYWTALWWWRHLVRWKCGGFQPWGNWIPTPSRKAASKPTLWGWEAPPTKGLG